MARTYILLVWIELLQGSFIEAGVPLISRSYSSWPSIRSYSKSIAPPFLTATPCLSVFHNLSIAPVIPSPDVGFIPEPTEITEKTSVILHKVHKNSENEISLTLKLVKGNDDDLAEENLEYNEKYLGENISPDVKQDDLRITCPVDNEIETENETETEKENGTAIETEIETATEDFPQEIFLINEDIPLENITINEYRSTDGDNDATQNIFIENKE